jgi:hypothetical protein
MSDLRTQLLDAIEGVHERPINYPQFGVSGIILREFTARERQAANEAVTLDNADNPDQILFRAMLLQRCITDPETGEEYKDGRRDPTTGKPAIDPRTRRPIFTVTDIQSIADGRAALFNTLWDDLLEVASMTGAALFSRDHAADGSERGTGEGDQGAGSAVDEDAGKGTGNADERAAHVDPVNEADGASDS